MTSVSAPGRPAGVGEVGLPALVGLLGLEPDVGRSSASSSGPGPPAVPVRFRRRRPGDGDVVPVQVPGDRFRPGVLARGRQPVPHEEHGLYVLVGSGWTEVSAAGSGARRPRRPRGGTGPAAYTATPVNAVGRGHLSHGGLLDDSGDQQSAFDMPEFSRGRHLIPGSLETSVRLCLETRVADVVKHDTVSPTV